MLHGGHWYEMVKEIKDLGYTGHNFSQDHVHYKMIHQASHLLGSLANGHWGH